MIDPQKPQKLKTRSAPLRLCLLLLASLTLAGCGEATEQDVGDLMQRAIELRAAGDHRGAIIELKNVLKNDSKSAEARLLLAEIYLGVGDGASAEKEAKLAMELGAKRIDALQTLGKSLLLQNQPEKVLKQFIVMDGSSAAIKAIIHILRGDAQFMLGQIDRAEKNYDAAFAAYRVDIQEERPHLKITELPESVDAIVGLVKVSMKRKDWKKSRVRLDQALALGPELPEVLATKGAFELAQTNYAQAEDAYKAAFAARPYNANYQIQIARAQLGQDKNKEAVGNLDAVLEAFPNHVGSNYFRALAAYRMQDYETAKTYVETVFRNDSNHVPSYLIAGGTSYALGQLEQANRYLSLYLTAVPGNDSVRKLLSATLLKLGRAGDAMVTLRPISTEDSEDVSLLSIIGAAAVASGDLSTGDRFLRKAAAAEPKNARLKARSAIIQIAMGDTNSGLRDLEDAIGRDPKLADLESRLILGYIREKRFDEAVTAARRLQERRPDDPTGFTLEGLAEFSRSNIERARELFEKSLKVWPGDPTAAHNLALLHLKDGNSDLALKSYRAVFEFSPHDVATLLRLARVEVRLNNRKVALGLLEKALAADPKSVTARTRMARILVEDGKSGKALTLAQEGLRNAPDNLALLETIGIAQLETARYQDAVLTFTRITELSPNSLPAFSSLARASYFSGNAPRAKEALNRILRAQPDHRDALVLLVQIALFQRDLDAVRAYLPRLRKIKGAEPVVADIETNLALAEDKPKEAVAALKRLAALRDDTNDTLRLTELLWRMGQREEAITRLRDWLKQYPNDQLSRFNLAQFFMMSAHWTTAKPLLEEIIIAAPDNVAAINNLAFVLFNIGDLETALTHARRANELAPGNAVPMDMIGVILLAQGKAEEAVPLLRRAAARPSDSQAPIRYHLAKALAAINRNEEAKAILIKVLDGKTRFDEIEDAKSLLARLSK